MFSLTSLQPQVVTALKQFSLIVNGSRALSTDHCLRGRKQRNLQKKCNAPQTEKGQSSQTDQEFSPLICSPVRGDKYVSSPTFFENKYGFEDPSFTGPAPLVSTSWTTQHKRLLQSRQLWHSSVRLFYVRREGTGDPRKEDPDQQGLKEVKKTVEDQYAVLKELADLSTRQASENKNLLKQQQLKNLEEKYGMLMTQVRELSSKKKSTVNQVVQILSYVAAVVLLLIIIVRITGSNVMNGNSKTFSVVSKDMIEEKFSDVHGMDEAKDDMIDIVKFLQNPEPFNQVGAKIPKGILLEGPPGVGKTMLARAVAGEAGVPFIFASGSEFDEIFVGVGAKRVRELFDTARHIAPCIVFIDEIDSLATTRTQSPYSTPAAYQSINQLLTELDGFQSMNGIILIAATNRKDALDPAILRPGRLDMHISVEKPDLKGREKMFQQYLSKVKHDPDINIRHLALGTSGFTGADISSMVNQAALKAGIDGVSSVNMSHLNYAKDKILMGSEKKTRTPDERVNWCTAIHEAGHTIVGMESKTSVTDVYKVTIKSRGGNHSLGHTQFLPKTELYDESRAQLMNELDICMGGRVAEEIIFGANEVTTGASSDFKTATSIAKQMVMYYGMSDNLGMRVYSKKDLQMMSPKMRREVDDEVNKLLQDSYNRTKKLLLKKKDKLTKLAEMLMKYETLDMEEIKLIMEGKNIARS